MITIIVNVLKRASERYREALKKLRDDDAEKAQFFNEKTEAKNKAMEIERSRAARVAALDPPVPDIAQNLETIQKQRYKRKSIDHYNSTYYHIPQERVERADPNLHQVSEIIDVCMLAYRKQLATTIADGEILKMLQHLVISRLFSILAQLPYIA